MTFFPYDVATPAETPRLDIDWEEADCLLCGQRDWLPLVESQDPVPGRQGLWFVVVQCQKCGLCFTNPRPAASSIHSFYLRSGRSPLHRSGAVKHNASNSRRLAMPRYLAGRAAITKPGRLLDFGCGSGGFLHRMREHGWQVMGLDTSPHAVEHARQDPELSILPGTLPHEDLASRRFDLVTMWHSLSRAHQPLQILREVHRLLAPGGKIMVAVPNIDSLPFRWFGSSWTGLDLPRNLTHFAPWTLHLMLERAGFRVVGPLHMIRHSKSLRLSARRSIKQGSRTGWRRWLRTPAVAKIASYYCSLVHQSDCIMVVAER